MTIFTTLVLGLILQCIWTRSIISPSGKGDKCKEVLPNIHFSCAGRNLSYIPSEIPPSTENLDFSFNYLRNLHQDIFPQLLNLHVLDLTRCHIQVIADNAFHNVRNVTTLILTGNHFKYLRSHNLALIQELVVVETGLSSLDDLHIQPVTKLQMLNAGTNNIRSMTIPRYFINCSNVGVLDLHANKIFVITADDTVLLWLMRSRNITIILSRNHIFQIEPGAFKNIYLQELHLLDTFLSSSATKSNLLALRGLKVGKLVVGHYRDTRMLLTGEDNFMDGLCTIDFQEIYFRQGDIGSELLNVFRCMLNATKITVVQGSVGNMEVVKYRQIKEIQLRSVSLFSIPAMQFSHLHTLETLIIKNNGRFSQFNSGFVDLPLLKHLDLSNNQLFASSCCQRFFNGTPQIRHLNMSYNFRFTFDPMPFQGLESLEVLDLQHTKINSPVDYPVLINLNRLKYLDISYASIIFKGPLTMQGLGSLKVLIISGNSFQGDSINYVFANLTNLKHLDISNCGIEDLHWSSFTQLNKLRNLVLSSNKLMTVDFLTNPGLVALTHIDTAQNNIVSISQKLLSNLPTNLSIFDLSRNPIDCSCANTDLIIWAIHHKEKLTHLERTLCKTLVSTYANLIEFDISYCRRIWEVKIVVAIIIVCLILILSAVAHKYQFYLRYGCILLRGYKSPKRVEFQYDAFVIYSSKDEAWVMEELVENIEGGEPPIQLCLHVRDFEAGKSITSNIIDEGITGSRKVIVVVSQHFINSAWCRFEFEIAQSWLVLERNAGLLLVILENVEEEKTKTVMGLHKYLRRNTYLKWKGNALSKARFWKRLRKAIIAGK